VANSGKCYQNGTGTSARVLRQFTVQRAARRTERTGYRPVLLSPHRLSL